MALTRTGLVIEIGSVLQRSRLERDAAVLSAARAIDAGDEQSLDTERVRILVLDTRIKYLERELAAIHRGTGAHA